MTKKWTFVDTVIVIAVVAAAAAGFKMFGGRLGEGDKTIIQAQILIPNESPQLAEAIEQGVGEAVTLSLTEKDSGILKSVEAKQAEVMVYDAINGEYKTQYADNNVDIYATVEVEVEENDYSFLVGSTQIKVGNKTPFRGKGYATEGNVIVIEREGE